MMNPLNTADDWGLLSVADIIDSVVSNDNRAADTSAESLLATSNEDDVPGFLLDAALVPRLQRSLLSSLRKRLAARYTRIERIFAARFTRVQQSLSSSKHIRQRLSEAIVSMGASLPRPDEHGTLLSTIALLGAITDNEAQGSYTTVLLDSIAQVNLDLASPQSCLELFSILETHAGKGGSEADEHTSASIARAKLDLALRSGRLSPLLKCMVSTSHSLAFNPPLFPPKSPSPCVSVSTATISDFLVKTVLLPSQFHYKEVLHCFAHNRTLMFLSDEHVALYEAMGTMGTRLTQRTTKQLSGQRGDYVLFLDEITSARLRPLGRDEHFWHFAVSVEDPAGERHGCLALHSSGLSLADVRFHFCVAEKDRLCCLASSHPQQRTRSFLYVGDVSLVSILGTTVKMKLLPLLRNPSANTTTARRNAFHFTKSVSVTVGRVTLKEKFHPFCIELWVFPRNVSRDQIFLSIGDKSVDEVLLGLEPVGDGVRWRGGARTPRLGPSYATYTSAGKLSVLERWWHVALNFNGATWELWLDHELVSRQPALVSPNAIAQARCEIGKNYIGLIAEVRIWEHTRTAAELARDARRPLSGSEDGLCAYFPLNEGYGNVIMDYSPRHEHALLPHGEPYWCAVDSFPVLDDARTQREALDFVPQTWIEDPDGIFFAASPYSYTVAGMRSDHTLCVFDYARDHRCLVSQRSVELPVSWRLKSVCAHTGNDSLFCCAVSTPSTATVLGAFTRVFLWDLWAYAGHSEAAPYTAYMTPWDCGKAVLTRSVAHAKRLLWTPQYLTDQSIWSAVVPPLLLDPDDGVFALLLQFARHAMGNAQRRDADLIEQVCSILEVNLMARFHNSQPAFECRMGGCYNSVDHLLRAAAESDSGVAVAAGNSSPAQLRDSITFFALISYSPKGTSSHNLLRCCCQCFLTEADRLAFLEEQSGRQRSSSAETIYSCLLMLYSSLHTSYSLLSSQPAKQLSSLFAALFSESVFQVDHSLRVKNGDGLQRTCHSLEVIAEVLLSGGGLDGEVSRLETLQCAYSSALLRCCEKMVDSASAAVRHRPDGEITFLRYLQLSPVGALLASFSVSLPLLPTAALAACSTSLQKCRESLLILADRFTGEEAKRWASQLCVALTYSLAQLGCTLLDPLPPFQETLAFANSHPKPSENRTAAANPGEPPYLCVLRNGQRRSNTERDAFIKNLQGGVGILSRVFEELQRKDLSALRVVRDEQLRETERQVMAACCALLLPTRALREPSPSSLQPAFQLVLKLRPWILSKRQESKEYVAKVRARAIFLALFEPVADVGDDEAATGTAVQTASVSTSSRKHIGINSDANTSNLTERQRWRRLFKSWKAMRQLKALMSSREEVADMNVVAEIVACFQSDVSTSEMEEAVAWRSKKAQYRLVGLQLLWQLTEEAQHSRLLARVLHPVIARALCGWHYADGVEGCSVEQLTRLQSAFFLLLQTAVKAYEGITKHSQPWVLLLSALFSTPFRRGDLRRLRNSGASAQIMIRLWTSEGFPESLYQRVNGPIPWSIRATKLTPAGCASTLTVGATGTTLRSSGGCGSCVAPCRWSKPPPGIKTVYYYEVRVVDQYQGGYVSVGLGPANYNLSQMPGWDSDSFAYDGLEGAVYTNCSARVIGSAYGIGDVVGCGWNMEENDFFWTRNGKCVYTIKATHIMGGIHPLIGMKGKGCLLVNFGARPFVYQTWSLMVPSSTSRGATPKDFGGGAHGIGFLSGTEVSWDGWDAFRVFSIRAATVLSEAAAQNSCVSSASLEELGETTGRCLDALVGALTSAAEVPLSQLRLPAQYVTTLLGHITVLGRILRGVPSSIIASHTGRADALLARMAVHWLLAAPRAEPFGADESETVAALLTAWYCTMHLAPPTVGVAGNEVGSTKGNASENTATSSSRGPTSAAPASAGSAASPSALPNILEVLLQLAGCVITTSETRMSASETRYTLDGMPVASAVTSCDTAHWLALSLLQRLNSDCDEHGQHAWQPALQEWLGNTLREGQRATGEVQKRGSGKTLLRDALLALAILGGIPRLTVPGDKVMAHLAPHTIVPVLLLSVSWSEEICDILELQTKDTAPAVGVDLDAPLSATSTVKTLPLRFVHAAAPGDEPLSVAFPIVGNEAHRRLAEMVAQLSLAWFPAVTSVPRSSDVMSLLAQLSCVLMRCAQRHVVWVPPELIRPLSLLMGMGDDVTSSMDHVRLELVLSLWGLLRCRQRRGLPRASLGTMQTDRASFTCNEGDQPMSRGGAGRGLVRVGTGPAYSRFTPSPMRLQTFSVLDPLLEGHLLGLAHDDPDAAYEEDEEGTEVEDEDDSEFGTRSPYLMNDVGEAGEEEESADEDEEVDPSRLVADVRARTDLQLSISSIPDALFFPTEPETFDTLHFNGGCLRIAAGAPLSLSFTIDLALRPTNVVRHQIIFAQVLRGGNSATAVELVARILKGSLEFGWLSCAPGGEAECDPAEPGMICTFALSEADVNTWIRVTFVQSGTTLSLLRSGLLLDARSMRGGGGSLLQEELRLGGIPRHLDSTAFFGDIRNFRVYELALRPAMVEQLRRLNSSLSTFLESHLAVLLKSSKAGVENVSKTPACVTLDVWMEGDVGYLDDSEEAAARNNHARELCVQELDFGADSDEQDLRIFTELLPSQQAGLWYKKRGQNREQLLSVCSGCYQQLAAFYSAHILAYTLCRIVKSSAEVVEVDPKTMRALTDDVCVARLAHWAVSTSGDHMTALLNEMWLSLCQASHGSSATSANITAMWEIGNTLLIELLRIAQQSQHTRVFESVHPQRPPASDVYEVQMPGQNSYAVFMDERSVASWRLVTVSADRNFGALLSDFCSAALSSFEVSLPHFFLTIRSVAESANWGHRIAVVYNYKAQMRAMRLFRSALSASLSLQLPINGKATAYLWSVECLMSLCAVAQRNTSKTRLIALTCLNHLLLYPQCFRSVPPSLSLPLLMHDVRRMALRHYRRRLPTQRVLGRFIQLSMESYVMQRDAAQCWQAAHKLGSAGRTGFLADAVVENSAAPGGMVASSDASAKESASAILFKLRRQEQLQLYRQREHGADRVRIQKLRNPQSLALEWNGEGVCILRSEGSGGSAVAGVPLTAGRWYYELRIGDAGNFAVGVLPVPTALAGEHDALALLTNAAMQGHEPVTFNGYTGVLYRAGQFHSPPYATRQPLWFSRDYLGIIIDVVAQCCSILVNGVEVFDFAFGPEAANETAADSPSARIAVDDSESPGGVSTLLVSPQWRSASPRYQQVVPNGSVPLAYYPYVSMEQADSLSLNFGAAYFEHEVPSGCLPLDPANLSLGTMFPYNQMRSLQDIAAHLFTGGRYPLPPFYHEEVDPFAGSTERMGPAHVSVQASANVQVNIGDVKNTGLGFETVLGDCSVGAGAWYFEVTLRTQGLMQIGWMQRGEVPHGDGHGVGDSSTSWSIDLFRRVMWHRGVPEPVNLPRRWTTGDVVGCAVDMNHGELTFFLNGRPIAGTTSTESESPLMETCTFRGIPQGLYYVPAVSLRSGGAVSFNFGSSPFKHKPEGFNPLGVPDSWNERMDTFYNNASATSTQQRLAAMQEAWRVLRVIHPTLGASSVITTATTTSSPTGSASGAALHASSSLWHMEALEANLLPYRLVVQAVDSFSSDITKAFAKSTEIELRQYLANYSYSDTGIGVSGGTDLNIFPLAKHSWEIFRVLKAVSKVIHALLPFLSLNTTHPTLMTLLFLSLRTLLFRAVRRKLVDSVLSVSSARSEQYRISINRVKAHGERHSVKSSVFGQTFSLLGSQSARIFQTHQRFWNTVFLGEGAEDAGGPFREHLSEMCRELMSDRLPFFVPTANRVHNTGSHRDAYVPAASAQSTYDLEAFAFIGRLIGGAMRSDDPLDLFLPPMVWRYLCAYPITETEVEQVDAICVQCIREFRSLAATNDATVGTATPASDEDNPTKLFEDVFGEEFFVTQLSDSSRKELVEGGARVRVTLARSGEYAEALLQARIHEFDLQLHKMREGLLSVVPEVAVLLLTPEELEMRVCGQADYTPEELRKEASYEGLTSEDRRVQLLWKALEEATPQQRRLFLRFVSGRDRLPVKLRILPFSTKADADTILPRAATCFFAIELPDYSSLEVMKRKLYYSIENCADMDTDFNARIVDEDEAPQLSVAVDDGRHDVTLPTNTEDE